MDRKPSSTLWRLVRLEALQLRAFAHGDLLHADTLQAIYDAVSISTYWADPAPFEDFAASLGAASDEQLRRIALAALVASTGRWGWQRQRSSRSRQRADREPRTADREPRTSVPVFAATRRRWDNDRASL